MKNQNNISYKLLERRQICDYLDNLKGKTFNTKEFEKIIVKLAAMGEQVVPVCINKLKTAEQELLGILNLTLEMLGDEDIIDPLLKLLTEPNLPDINKTCILNILCYFDYDPSELPLEEMFKDFKGITESSLDNLLNDITKDNNTLPLILEEFGSFPVDFQINLIDELVEKQDKRSIPLISVFARSGDKKVATVAIKGLGKMLLPDSATALESLKNQGDEAIRNLAARESLRLQMNGVRSNNRKLKKITNQMYKIYLSSIDGRGNRVVWFTWRVPNRKTLLISVNLVINTELGIKDCWGNNRLTVKEFDAVYNDLAKECVLLETSPSYILTLIKDALWKNRVNNESLPAEFAYWRQFLPEEDLYPQEYKPVPIIFNEEEMFGDGLILEKIASLHDETEFSDWYELNPQVYRLAEEFLTFSSGCTDSIIFSEKLSRFNRHFYKAVIKDKIPEIMHRLSLVIEFLELAGKEQLAMTAKGCLFYLEQLLPEDHPFIKRMIYESIRIAINNMQGDNGEGTNKSLF
ncbi:MAG: HEAT repeat domain-containing protein [Clostridia bacterium]|nr:HEAT repeat domain-containing protein [Clostridia bacterium]